MASEGRRDPGAFPASPARRLACHAHPHRGMGRAMPRLLGNPRVPLVEQPMSPVMVGDWKLETFGVGARTRPNPLSDALLFVLVDDSTECWPWTGPRDGHGYGSLTCCGVTVRAHRTVYQQVMGPIDSDLHLHHLCGNKLCCNPAHLQPLTNSEHRHLHTLDWCRRGHSLEDAYIAPDGQRRCRVCVNAGNRAAARRRKDALRAGTFAPPHGIYRYSCGCRCDVCRAAKRDSRRQAA